MNLNEWLTFLQKAEIKAFIQEHLHSDINKLLLNPPSGIAPFSKEVIAQIQARQKAKRKLDSWASNLELILPPPISVEQASSEQTANYKASIFGGQHLIDLTGGMGVDTLALSKSFDTTTYVEQQKVLAEIFSHNCKKLGQEIEVVTETAESFLYQRNFSTEQVSFYLDPARRDDAKNKVFNLEDCSPNLVELQSKLKEIGVNILVKLSPFLDIKLTLQKISNVKEVHVVSVKNECKEVLVLIDYSFPGEPEIKTINLDSQDQIFHFKFSEENSSSSQLNNTSKFILEPNASILKAGAFNQIAAQYDVEKLHANTHLYTAEKPINNWPGKTFEVIVSQADKKAIADFAKDGFINVLTRNYPLSPSQLKKKFKVKDGGDFFLIGFTDMNQKSCLVIAKKVKPTND